MRKENAEGASGAVGRSEGISHSKHRARMREKILRGMASALAPHELLETVLWTPIARKDTNVLGHMLIDRFRTVYGVMHAKKSELMQVDGIGERAAEFLIDFGRAAEACERSRTRAHESVTDPETAERIVKDYFAAQPKTDAALLGLDGVSRLIDVRPLESAFSAVDMISAAVRMDARRVILAFRDDSEESPAREGAESESIALISRALAAVGAEFCDYIVLHGSETSSYRRRLNPTGKYVERSELEGRPVLHFGHGVGSRSYAERPRAAGTEGDIMGLLSREPQIASYAMSREINRLYEDLPE